MMNDITSVIIYYHDPVEVDPSISWTGLSSVLKKAKLVDIKTVNDPKITSLFDYARPDAVITVDGLPIVSIEQTQMNPSGHNIPQRFSFHVRSAELGISSILFYPEYSRRTFSDPNVRYLQVRVPLAQKRLSQLYGVPAVSIFWPTNTKTKLPETSISAHQEMANVVTALVKNSNKKNQMNLPEVQNAFKKMDNCIQKYAKKSKYRENQTIRKFFPHGLDSAKIDSELSIDPPGKVKLIPTSVLLNSLKIDQNSKQNNFQDIKNRKFSLLFSATTSKSGIDSEHPWPGYFTLLDILYARKNNSKTKNQRHFNMVYELPADVTNFTSRINQKIPPTATYIVDSFADLIILDGGVIVGKPIRGNTKAIPNNY